MRESAKIPWGLKSQIAAVADTLEADVVAFDELLKGTTGHEGAREALERAKSAHGELRSILSDAQTVSLFEAYQHAKPGSIPSLEEEKAGNRVNNGWEAVLDCIEEIRHEAGLIRREARKTV